VPDIVTLTINPAVDIFVNVPHVEPVRKMRCSAPKRDPGGGGINVARVAHRLGSNVAAIYPTGGAIGKLLQRLVEREGIDSVVTPSHVETRENFTAYEESSGEQFRFVLPGSALHRAEWEACLDTLATLPEKPKFVVASGSIPPGVPGDFYAHVARIAKKLGAKMVLDTSGRSLAPALDEGVSLIKPNQNELSEFVGKRLDRERDYIAASRELIKAGRAEAVALTLGEDGALLVNGDREALVDAPLVEPVDTTGAGDCFNGVLAAAWWQGLPLEVALRRAVTAAALSVTVAGAREGMPTAAGIDAALV
jgi:6-phosphofructokinase 2